MVVIRDQKPFYFNFHWPKDVNENSNLEIKFVIKSNETLTCHKY